jgi:hypothetical protein
LATDPDSGIAASVYETPMHRIEAKEDALKLYRKFPPTEKVIAYEEIATVEHTRLIDYNRLITIGITIVLLYAINYVDIVQDILSQLVLEVGNATGTFTATEINQEVLFHTQGAIEFLTALFIIVAGYYMIRFALSLSMRFVVYRTGKNPIAIPMRLTSDAMDVLSKVNTKVKEAKGISKEEAEKIVGDQIRGLLEERAKMQEDLMTSVKVAALAAKTDKEKAKVKQMLDESIAKLEARDEVIDQELKKTGLTKEDLFKKYRIKAPKDEFVDSILSDDETKDLLSKK